MGRHSNTFLRHAAAIAALAISALASATSTYDKLFKDAKDVSHKEGMISIHKAGDKIYLEIPDSLMGRDFLVDSYVSGTSDVGAVAPGQKAAPSKRILIDRTDSLVFFRVPGYGNGSKDSNIAKALGTSGINAIAKAFPIAAWGKDSLSVLFDATSYFKADNKDVLDLSGASYGDNLIIYSSEYVSDRSRLVDVDVFKNSVSVSSEAGLKLSIAFILGVLKEKPELSLNLVTTLTLLPEKQMRPREADARIGTSYVRYTTYGTKDTRQGFHAAHWNLEPKGEGSGEPKKPITVYVDTLFTPSWAKAVEEGILSWNKAFEAAGYVNAIKVLPYPSDKDFRSEDPMLSRVTFSPSTGTAVTVRLLADPRSGEIMSFQMTVPRDFASSVRREALYAIASVDTRYANYYIPDDALRESLRAKVIQKMGTALGLSANLAGSAAYSAGQMRDPAFTKEHGFLSSVMDGVTYNFAALPGDKERGVETIVTKPGAYDEFAIKWLYSPLPEKDETRTLKTWLDEKEGDPVYLYGGRNANTAALDPRFQQGDLGSDILPAIKARIENLKYVLRNSKNWIDDSVPDDYKTLYPDFLFLDAYAHVSLMANYVGGIYKTEPRAGRDTPVGVPVPKETQRKMVKEVLDFCDDLSWMDESQWFMELGGPNGDMTRMACTNMPVSQLFGRLSRMTLSVDLSDDPYTQKELLDDIREWIFKEVRSGKPLSPKRTIWASQLISRLISGSDALKASLRAAKNGGFSKITSIEDDQEMAMSPAMSSDGVFEAADDLGEISFRADGESAVGASVPVFFYAPKDLEPLFLNQLRELRKDMAKAVRNARTKMDRDGLKYYVATIDLALGDK